MGETLSWSIKMRSAAGVALGDTGTVPVDAVTIAPAELEANMSDPLELHLQLADVDKIGALIISSSVYDGKVEVEGDNKVRLTGPLLLYGDAIKLFASTLNKISVQNHSDQRVDLQILIGRKLRAEPVDTGPNQPVDTGPTQ